MPSSLLYTPNGQRVTVSREKGRVSPLPTYADDKPQGKYFYASASGSPRSWYTILSIYLPVLQRRLRIPIPIPPRLHQSVTARFGRKRGWSLIFFTLVALSWIIFALTKRFLHPSRQWPTPPFMGDPPTLVFGREDLQKVWDWEISSGHYPSRHPIPKELRMRRPSTNPAVPLKKVAWSPPQFRPPPNAIITSPLYAGPQRVYLDIQSQPPNVAYPPRPVAGTVADLDVVMENCDFSKNKYVRDCLEILRLGGGLDSGKRVRRGNMDDWKYIYREEMDPNNSTGPAFARPPSSNVLAEEEDDDDDPAFEFKRGERERPLRLPPPVDYRPIYSLPTPCDVEHPRIYHMFWAGPFTDKPYLALLSFLFTQNLGLHLPPHTERAVCRPKFWLWINPGPAAAVPNPRALSDMFDELAANPWASPFLHPRFADVIEFKLWNTTEQLDGIPEIKDEWRILGTLFNSGGHKVNVPKNKEKDPMTSSAEEEFEKTILADENVNITAPFKASATQFTKGGGDDLIDRLGSKSSSSYDRLSVILSDMARFVLCHRFGGVYLDADVLLLRDWEELWGWKGAFAYRWSRLEKYNTAVLHMNKHSALGSFIFRTAWRNALDLHPMTISRYTKDAYLEPLLLRLPDAMFDPAWLNTENFQMDRPPYPFFTSFDDFFETPLQMSGAPQALGFDAFFRGAYAYHFHNGWWKPFDPARNWPELGPRFEAGERSVRGKLNATDLHNDRAQDDKRDLDWATVLKRTFESYIRGERPNMYGEWLTWT